MFEIRGAEGWSDDQLLEALDRGGRVLVFERVTSIIAITFTERVGAVIVLPGDGWVWPALGPSLWTALLGWWAMWGLLRTPMALFRNLALGGHDLTDLVRDALDVARRERARLAGQPAPDELDELIPDTPEARRAAAHEALERGDVATARNLLEDMLTPGPHQDRALLHRLAVALYDRREMASSLAVFEVLARDFPAQPLLGPAQSQVRHAERTLGRTTSIVPPPRWHQTSACGGALVGALVLFPVLLVLGANEWERRHRKLYVVNGTDHAVVVRFADGEVHAPITLGATTMSMLVLAEGDHALVIEHPDGRREQTLAPVRATWMERMSPSVYVVNVDRAAAFLCYEVSYGNAQVTRGTQLHVGESFTVEHDVDVAFAPAPAVVELRDGARGATRTAFEWLRGRPERVVEKFPTNAAGPALDYLELHLRLAPADEETRRAYERRAAELGQSPRARAFLAPR